MISIKNYVLAILLAISLGLGYFSYSLIGQVATADKAIEQYQEKLDKADAKAKEVEASCESTIKALKESQRVIDEFNDGMQKDLNSLNRVPEMIAPTTPKQEAKADEVKKDAPDRLSPAVMQLLDNAYCSGAKNDTYCTARSNANRL